MPSKYDQARNPNTPPNILTLLSKDEDPRVRWHVAENPNTPPTTLAFLSKDWYWGVRSGVAGNPNTPYGIWIADYGRVIP